VSAAISGQASNPARYNLNLRLTGIGLLAFLCGASVPIVMNVVGQLYLCELLLPLGAIACLCSRQERWLTREPVFLAFMLAIVVMFAGYVLSDFVRDTDPSQYLRGWGRIFVTMLNFVCLTLLLGQDRRNLWWFCLGMGAGGALYLRLVLHSPISVWKFGYAEPVVFVVLALGCFLPRALIPYSLVTLGVISMWFDFRSFAALCFVLAACMWIRGGRARRGANSKVKAYKLWISASVAGLLLATMLAATQNSYTEDRRDQSNAGREAAFEVGLYAIGQSPVIGYGSWTRNRDLAKMYMARYLDKLGVRDPNAKVGQFFSPHSQLLQSWVEGGILGAAFFLLLGYRLLRSARWAALGRPVDMLTPLILYVLLSCAWNVLMSPFGAPHRVPIALGASVLVLVSSEHRAWRALATKGLVKAPARQNPPGALNANAY
jgi:O-antigen ligase